ncbi:MAG: DNA internalization-related competence protein ComEC/Rec2 [Armatimonadota bacterium]
MTFIIPVAASYIAGVVSCYNKVAVIFVFPAALAILLFLKMRLKQNFSTALIPIILIYLLLGYFLTQVVLLKNGEALLDFLENKNITATGIISNVSEKKNNELSIMLKLQSAVYENVTYKQNQVVNVFIHKDLKTSSLRYGDIIKLSNLKLRKPAPPSYPGEFNYQKYLLCRGINYTAYAHKSELSVIQTGKNTSIGGLIFALRRKIVNLFNSTVYGENASLLNSIVLGEKNLLPGKLDDAFIKTGTLHLIAASGFNVAILILFCFTAGGVFKIKKKLIAVPAIALIIIYTLLCGGDPSITRAAVLGIFAMAAVLFGKEKESVHLLILAGLLILLFKPLWLFDIGFQLSFLACFGILFISPVFQKKLNFMPEYLNSLISVTLGAQIMLVPVLIYYFGRISVTFIIANLLLIPIVEILLPLGLIHIILGFILPCILPLTSIICYSLSFMFLKIIYFLNKVPFSLIGFSKPGSLTFILFYSSLCAILYHYNKPDKKIPVKIYLICALTILGLFISSKFIDLNTLTVTFLNIPGGDCIHIKTPGNKNILIDTGSSYIYGNKVYDCAEKTILPYLKQEGIKKIDLVIITHMHNDHIGGLATLLKNIPVKAVAGNFTEDLSHACGQALKYIKLKNITLHPLKEKDIIKIKNDLNFFVLFPDDEPLKKDNLNNTSIVIKLAYKDTSFLFTGDIEEEAEKRLIYNPALKSNVLKVAHQGSKTSSSYQFLKKVSPSFAVISAGRYNHFNHPHSRVINAIKSNNIRHFITSCDGPVIFKSNGKNIRFYLPGQYSY